MKTRNWFYWCLVLVVPLVFHKAFFAGYLMWDDDVLILNNPVLKLSFFEALQTSFTSYYHGDFFPLTLMSYWLDVNLFGVNSSFQHVENLLLHLGAVLLLFSCLLKLTKKEDLAFLIALIFAVHPLQSEPVMWLSERKSLLSAVLTFLSLRFYLNTFEGPKKGKWYLLAGLTFGIGGLAKATALLMPLLFLLIDFFFIGKNSRVLMRRFLPLAILSGGLILLRIQAYTTSSGMGFIEIFTTGYWQTIPFRAFYALGFYVKSFFIPSTTSAIYPDFTMDFVTQGVTLVTLGVMGYLTYRIWRKKELFPLFCWAWFILFLLPVLQIFPRINYINERYMYLPLIGLAGVTLDFVKEKYFRDLSIALAGIMAGVTILHTEAWTNNRNLWTQTLKLMPESKIALNNLALDYQGAGEFDKAVQLYEKILAQANKSANNLLAYNNLASIYTNPKYPGFNPQRAVTLLQDGIRSAARLRDTYELRVNLGMLLSSLSQREAAREVLTSVLADLSRESDYRFQGLKPLVEQQLAALSSK